jgi:mono/diheme cytochrome c family protein
MAAISSGQIVLLIVAGSLLLLAGIASLILRGRRRRRGPDIPPVMRPGPSDADLETPLLQKLQGWGVVLVAFFVIWIPIVWLQEPDQNLTQERALLTDSIARGAREVQLFSEDNQLGVGCVRCHGPELRGGTVIPNGTNPTTGQPQYGYPLNLTTVCSRLTPDEIRTTIEQGRIAQGMPSWSIRFAGALDDQQITDLIDYLIYINRKTVPFDQNKCINPDLATSATPAAAVSVAPSGGK